eukprot:5362455-Ditylum_brightwellii.AAC.1
MPDDHVDADKQKEEPAENGTTTTTAPTVIREQEHEASYDAYMTGVVFIGLCRRIIRRVLRTEDDAVREAFHNALFQTEGDLERMESVAKWTWYTINLRRVGLSSSELRCLFSESEEEEDSLSKGMSFDQYDDNEDDDDDTTDDDDDDD